jgi:hypothetical protein
MPQPSPWLAVAQGGGRSWEDTEWAVVMDDMGVPHWDFVLQYWAKTCECSITKELMERAENDRTLDSCQKELIVRYLKQLNQPCPTHDFAIWIALGCCSAVACIPGCICCCLYFSWLKKNQSLYVFASFLLNL